MHKCSSSFEKTVFLEKYVKYFYKIFPARVIFLGLGFWVQLHMFFAMTNLAIPRSYGCTRIFSHSPEEADDNTVQQYAWAYLLMLVGSVIYLDPAL